MSANPAKPLTLADLETLPAVVDLPTAAAVLGIGRTKPYQLAQSGEFPCRVLRIGRRYRAPVSALLGCCWAAGPPPAANRVIRKRTADGASRMTASAG